ncbi:MAG: hypothetical protein GF308_05960 [Candidatus Heimdallarchaeota archaeon]|nr:hypothetical protein [Candidatus Heimdallarchaeota archaeon]
MNKLGTDCKKAQHECGKFSKKESKEEKLKHLKECKASLLQRVKEIDKAIEKLG